MPRSISNAETKKTFDLHSAGLMNQVVINLTVQIDYLALVAMNTMRYDAISKFNNAVEILYLRVSPVIHDNRNIEIARMNYYVLTKMLDDKRYRNKEVLIQLLQNTKKMYHEIVVNLQKLQYFFRFSHKDRKSLKNIDFFISGIKDLEIEGEKENEDPKEHEEELG